MHVVCAGVTLSSSNSQFHARMVEAKTWRIISIQNEGSAEPQLTVGTSVVCCVCDRKTMEFVHRGVTSPPWCDENVNDSDNEVFELMFSN